jgi:hypothetical protein
MWSGLSLLEVEGEETGRQMLTALCGVVERITDCQEKDSTKKATL